MDSDGGEEGSGEGEGAEALRQAKGKVKCRQYCIARGCSNSNRSDPDLSFFSLPKDEHRRRQWLRSVGRTDLLSKPGLKHKSHVVCLAHFRPQQLRWIQHLRPDAVPGPADAFHLERGEHGTDGSHSRTGDGSSMLQKILLRVKPASRAVFTQTDSTLESHAAEHLAALRAARRAVLAEHADCTRSKLARLSASNVLLISTPPPFPLHSTRNGYDAEAEAEADADSDYADADGNIKVEPDLSE